MSLVTAIGLSICAVLLAIGIWQLVYRLNRVHHANHAILDEVVKRSLRAISEGRGWTLYYEWYERNVIAAHAKRAHSFWRTDYDTMFIKEPMPE